jgi:hypothetical protein
LVSVGRDLSDPTLQEAEEWARKLLGEKQPIQFGTADRLAVYSAYLQFLASEKSLEVSQAIQTSSEATRGFSESILRSTESVERLTRLVGVFTVLVATIALSQFLLTAGVPYLLALLFSMFVIIVGMAYVAKRLKPQKNVRPVLKP